MNDEEKDAFLKKISFTIGLCGSVKPENIARDVLEEIERHYKVTIGSQHE